MNKEKVIIFDSATLIGFAMNGLLPELSKLKESFSGRFIIPFEVKQEIIDTPIGIKKFELQALKLSNLLKKGILETPESVGIENTEISFMTKKLMNKANKLFFSKKREVKLIGLGETSCLSLSKLLTDKKVENILATDERTVRVLCENPHNLKDLIERKIHSRIEINEDNFDSFKGFKFIRSTELIYIAYKKGLVDLSEDKRILDALLWALKSTGCAISSEEIEEIKNLAKREGF